MGTGSVVLNQNDGPGPGGRNSSATQRTGSTAMIKGQSNSVVTVGNINNSVGGPGGNANLLRAPSDVGG